MSSLSVPNRPDIYQSAYVCLSGSFPRLSQCPLLLYVTKIFNNNNLGVPRVHGSIIDHWYCLIPSTVVTFSTLATNLWDLFITI